MRNEIEIEFTSVKLELIENLKSLPKTELSYYIALLLASIENESTPEIHMPMLTKANLMVNKLSEFYKNNTEDSLSHVTDAMNDLITESKMRTISQAIKKIIMQIVGCILALSIGILLSPIVLIAGLIGGILFSKFIIGKLEGPLLGFIVGFFIGVIIGTRIPNKLFQSEFDNKLDFVIKNIERVGGELTNKKSHDEYEQETKQYIIDNFFSDVDAADKLAAYEKFIASDDQKFQICTKTAGHFSKSLKGYLGHHAFIRFSINGISHIPIEFGDRQVVDAGRSNPHVDQSEKERTVTGQKLFDMLVMDRILQETHRATFSNCVKFYEIGSDDCRTYVDKILIATGQPPTEIRRFNAQNDKFIATSIIAPLFRFFNTTRENELDCFIEHFKDGNSHDLANNSRLPNRIESFAYQPQGA